MKAALLLIEYKKLTKTVWLVCSLQVINVFLVTTIANSILDTISQIVEEPTKSFTLLGEALPKVRLVFYRASHMLILIDTFLHVYHCFLLYFLL